MELNAIFDRVNKDPVLRDKFPGGYHTTDEPNSLYNCAGFIAHHFFPKIYKYEEPLEPSDVFKRSGGWFTLLEEHPINRLQELTNSQGFRESNILAFTKVVPDQQDVINHVALIKQDPLRGLVFESKLGSGNSPRIVNYALEDLVSYEQLMGEINYIQIYEAGKQND